MENPDARPRTPNQFCHNPAAGKHAGKKKKKKRKKLRENSVDKLFFGLHEDVNLQYKDQKKIPNHTL